MPSKVTWLLKYVKSVGNTAGEVNGQSEIHYLK